MVGPNVQLMIILQKQRPLRGIQWRRTLAGSNDLVAGGSLDDFAAAIVGLALFIWQEKEGRADDSG